MIHKERRYKYSKSLTVWGKPVMISDVKVEFIWDKSFNDGLIVVEFNNELYEPSNYNPTSYISSAKKFLKIIRKIEQINNIDELKEFLKQL